MSGAIVGITAAYAALAVLLLSLNVYSRWPAWVKIGAVVITGVFYYVSYLSLEGLLGWPTQSSLPREFVMLSGRVEEPDRKTGSQGAVYLWAFSLEHDRVSDQPRSYRLPYSESLHQEVGNAARKLRQGIVQMGRVEEVKIRTGGIGQSWLDEHTERIVIYDLPDPELPDK